MALSQDSPGVRSGTTRYRNAGTSASPSTQLITAGLAGLVNSRLPDPARRRRLPGVAARQVWTRVVGQCGSGEAVEQVLRVERDEPDPLRRSRPAPTRLPWPARPDCASITTVSRRNVSWTGVARSATSDTLRTASVNGPAGRSAVASKLFGNRESYLMNSVPISRAVSRRPPPSKLIMPSAGPAPAPSGPGWPNAIVTGRPGPMVRATSASVLAGTSAEARTSGSAGSQLTSRTASRYRSVAASLSRRPSKSRQTPVSMGSVSSRLAEGTTWAAAMAGMPPSTVPATPLGTLGQSAGTPPAAAKPARTRRCRKSAPPKACGTRDVHIRWRQTPGDLGQQPPRARARCLASPRHLGQAPGRAPTPRSRSTTASRPSLSSTQQQPGQHRNDRPRWQLAEPPRTPPRPALHARP